MSKQGLKEYGKFKEEIHTTLYKDCNIKELLLNDMTGMNAKEIQKSFKNHVKSHLFIDDTITETESYIFYDIIMPNINANIKNCKIILYAVCHRDILDDYIKDGYYGNRADILSQMIEECLIQNDDVSYSFGIGKLSLDSVDIYNSTKLYGHIMYFSVPNFR